MFTPRITWPQLPVHVRDRAEQLLAARVVEWSGQTGGFSPGVADRVVLDDGRRVFIKAVGPELNEGSVSLCRREITANTLLQALPERDQLPAPRMLFGESLDGDWQLLIFEDLDGHHPQTPWLEADFRAALESLGRLAELVPRAPAELPAVADIFGPDMDCLARAASEKPELLASWTSEQIEVLLVRAANAKAQLAGEALVQLDAREDNMVITADGQLWLVDWPWACRGPAWLDAVLLAMSAAPDADFDAEALIDDFATSHGGSSQWVTDVWIGMLGYFTWAASTPPPPNLPTIRDFQAHHRDRLIPLVRRRLGWDDDQSG